MTDAKKDAETSGLEAETTTSAAPDQDLYLEAYKSLFSYQMWTYDSFFKDFRFFLLVQLLLVGLVFKVLAEAEPLSGRTSIVLLAATAVGFALSCVWASRQSREYEFAVARLRELRRLEGKLEHSAPGAFQYHSRVFREVQERLIKDSWIWVLPFLPVPHIFRKRAFLRSFVFQRLFLLIWIAAAAILALHIAIAIHENSFQLRLGTIADRANSAISLEAVSGDAEAIRGVFERYDATADSGNLAGWLALLTDDVLWMAPDQPTLMGRDSVGRRMQPRFENLQLDSDTFVSEVDVAGEWAYARGTYAFRITAEAGGETIDENGEFLYKLNRQPDGSWRIARGIWNRNDAPVR